MRNILHHTLIITCNDRDVLESIRETAINLYKMNMEASGGSKLLTDIYESVINHYFTFFIIPDGSKEGYDASDDGDIIRHKLIEHIRPLSNSTKYHLSYAEISFGGDDTRAFVVHQN